ncbi:hypothetical protein HF289_16545 [Acidithiobacillus ferrooxidans]|jgi:hypothetical protein|uniref:hypothetical protein n=1 Tax=Acidithiobacillus ferrooxidans TaxID=920 RepID=UPI001C06EC57|nr:hypothetical protein [Acidithiobacillus ferrooxidans]MBU2858395.1 hypothetical protein [Acidithiobacillus ferrooxidans]MBU2861926.1 hypothetical protein [Acidithiobacillus ferrooxidans]
MRRISNLAFNQEFPEASGLSGIPADNQVRTARDTGNPYDRDAVGIWLGGHPVTPIGWLYRKDGNRDAVLQKLDASGEITGHIEQRSRRKGEKPRKVVVFWL